MPRFSPDLTDIQRVDAPVEEVKRETEAEMRERLADKPVGVVTMELEPHPKEKRMFMAKYERYEPRIRDSTAIQTEKTCPRKYFYQLVLGRVAKEDAPYFAWGSAYHTFRQVLEVAYGFGHEAPARYDETKAADAFAEAAKQGLAYWKKHGRDQPVGSKYEFMTVERLLKSFIHAFKHWAREKMQGRIVVIAVEQAFIVQLADGSYTGGRADQIVRWNGKVWGRDFKTSSVDSTFYSRRLEPNDQFTRYTLAEGKLVGEQVQGLFIELLYNAKPSKKDPHGPSIIELTTSRTRWQLDQFERDMSMVNKRLAMYREEDNYPMSESNCPFCPFHSVCTKPTEGAMMAQLETHFTVRPWDFTKIGMDT